MSTIKTDAPTIHTRTYTWSSPQPTGPATAGLTGLQTLHAIGAGTIAQPPALRTLGIEPVDAEYGRVVFQLVPEEFHYNPMGIVHGGVLMALLDTAMGCAVLSELPPLTGYTTIEAGTRFLRPVTVASGTITCTGTTISVRSRVAVAEARIEDDRGRLVATATSSCLLI
ncbi:PaaI family thioesterase [Antrihabitans sp. YC2-6]|uniref:PaaI family thioesterase n=1 Tax=Antrihabitans sp. YC2-6 TaxID=2799498 RepID=UPI0018F71213|nr:PaaI family thioesterase [Antrihabitans sp. YC2-6]MBJ8347243.1 PaaI family thioesterase [Antrihabitans sp. YC2-6]